MFASGSLGRAVPWLPRWTVAGGVAVVFVSGSTLAATDPRVEPQRSESLSEAGPGTPTGRPMPYPTPIWWATQLVPSPEAAIGSGAVHFGLRWQLTPLLYSWGVNRKVSGLRLLVVEPNVRQSGSVELFLSPEVVFTGEPSFLVRPGVRAYLPLLHHGEYLGTSIGVSYQRVSNVDAAAIECGVYVLYGTLGLQASFAPGPSTPLQTVVALRLRYF